MRSITPSRWVVALTALMALVWLGAPATNGYEQDQRGPVTLSELVTLLEAGVPLTSIEDGVRELGTAFDVTSEVEVELRNAGATDELLAAIRESFSRVVTDPVDAPQANGSLAVFSDPAGATVYLDGEARGQTPLNLGALVSGTYAVRVVLEGFVDSQLAVELLPGDDEIAQVNLVRNPALETLDSPRPANVSDSETGSPAVEDQVFGQEDAATVQFIAEFAGRMRTIDVVLTLGVDRLTLSPTDTSTRTLNLWRNATGTVATDWEVAYQEISELRLPDGDLVVQTADRATVLRLDDETVAAVLSSLESRAGLTVSVESLDELPESLREGTALVTLVGQIAGSMRDVDALLVLNDVGLTLEPVDTSRLNVNLFRSLFDSPTPSLEVPYRSIAEAFVQERLVTLRTADQAVVFLLESQNTADVVSTLESRLDVRVQFTAPSAPVERDLQAELDSQLDFSVFRVSGPRRPSEASQDTNYTTFRFEVREVALEDNLYSLSWDFGDGTSADGEAVIIRHTYSEAGTYVVQLTLTPGDSAELDALAPSIATKTIIVY